MASSPQRTFKEVDQLLRQHLHEMLSLMIENGDHKDMAEAYKIFEKIGHAMVNDVLVAAKIDSTIAAKKVKAEHDKAKEITASKAASSAKTETINPFGCHIAPYGPPPLREQFQNAGLFGGDYRSPPASYTAL